MCLCRTVVSVGEEKKDTGVECLFEKIMRSEMMECYYFA